MSDQIEIKIDAKRLKPETFLAAVKSFFELVEGVAKNIVGKPVEWTVNVDKGSAIVRAHIENPTPQSAQAINSIVGGIRSLRAGVRLMPNGFTENEIKASRKLIEIIDGKDVQSVGIRNGAAPEDLTAKIIETIDAILEGHSHMAFGSLEGRVVNISLRHTFSCTIKEIITHREIVCYLQKDTAQKDAVDSVNKRARILVNGLIHYAKEGYPISITADTVEVFPPESELPTIKDIQAIYKKYK